LNTCFETLTEASQEGFELNAEIANDKETIEQTEQHQSFSTPNDEGSKGDGDGLTLGEADVQPSPSQVNPSSPMDDAP